MGTNDPAGRWDGEWVDQLTDYAVVALDPSGVVTSWSAGAVAQHGRPAAEAVGRHLSMTFPPEDLAGDLPGRLLAEARGAGRALHTGWRTRRDGSRFWGDAVLAAVRDPGGTLTGFTEVVRDRTEQHETEERLRESEARFRLLVSQVSDYAIIGLDPSGVIVTWNAGAALVKGYTAAEAVGEHFSMFYTADDRRDGLPARLLERARHEGRVEHRGWRVRRDRTRFWGDVLITALHDDDGRLSGFAKVTRDLTDQHAVEQELVLSEQRFRLLVSQVQEYSIIGLDQSGTVTSWNVGAHQLKGWPSAEALGSHHSIFYTEEDRRTDLPARVLAEAREQGSVEHSGWRLRRDRTRFWADVVVTAVRDDTGRLQGFAEVTRDSSESHRLSEARDSFVSGVTHDFRSPLMVIGGFAALLADGLEDPEQREHAAHIVAGAERLSRLVELMLENSRLQSGPEPLACRELELTGFVRRFLGGLGAELGGRDVVVRGGQAQALVDEDALGRVLANVVGNAVKYSPAGSRIDVVVETVDPWVRVVVADRGRGIDPDDARLLFEQYQRGERAQRDGGLGIGLSVVRQLVTQMAGEVVIRPRSGGGTEVVVDLPAAVWAARVALPGLNGARAAG